MIDQFSRFRHLAGIAVSAWTGALLIVLLTLAVLPKASAADSAAYTSQAIATTMVMGKTYAVSITMRNNGTTTWVAAGANAYSLVAQNPAENQVWGIGRVSLTADVKPGTSATFAATITAPTTPGTYNFQWQMRTAAGVWFGASTPNVSIQVGQGTPSATITSPVGPLTMSSSGEPVTLRVTGTSAPNIGGSVSEVDLFDNNNQIALSIGAGPFDKTVSLSAGQVHWLRLRAANGLVEGFSTAVPVTVNATGVITDCAAQLPLSREMTVAGATGQVYGNNTTGYNIGSDLGSALMHAGLMTPGERASVTVTSLGQLSGVTGVTANGITSSDFGAGCGMLLKVGGFKPRPTVTIYKPESDRGVVIAENGTEALVAVNGEAYVSSNPSPIKKIELYDGTKLLATVDGDAFTKSLLLPLGRHQLKLVATNNVGQFGESQTVAVTVTPRVIGDGAQFVAQTAPRKLRPGEPFEATVTMVNTGNTNWDSFVHRLGAVSPENSTLWSSSGRASLSENLSTSSTGVIRIPIHAPSKVGTYNFQWRMVHEPGNWFGETTPNQVVIVEDGPGPTATLEVSPTVTQVVDWGTTSVAFKGSASSTGGDIRMLELWIDYGSRVDVERAANVTELNFSRKFGVGTYRVWLRATDANGVKADSDPVIVTVTNSQMRGENKGVRTGVNGKSELYGWACMPGVHASLNYQVLLDTPFVGSGTMLTSGVANVSTEWDNEAVQYRCGFTQTPHHFVVPLDDYIERYSGRRLYVLATSPDGKETLELSCVEGNCLVPGVTRVMMTTPLTGTRVTAHADTFLRMVVSNVNVPIDDIGFMVDGDWVPAKPDGAPGAYSASKAFWPTAQNHTVYARIRQSSLTIKSMEQWVTVVEGPLPKAKLAVTPTNTRVNGTGTATLTFVGSGIGSGPNPQISKVEVFQDSGTGYPSAPIKTLSGSAPTVDLNFTSALAAGVYKFKLRATDAAGVQSDSTPVVVNITNSPLLGLTAGVRIDAAGNPKLVGWMCQSGVAAPLTYQLLLDAPTPLAGGSVLTSGTANLASEPDDAAVQTQCKTPGASHHFAIDLSSYTGLLSGRQLYVYGQTTDGALSVSLPCADNTCTMPGALRVGITTPTNGQSFMLPNPAFLRMKVSDLDGAPITLDEVGFYINGTWIAASAELDAPGAYSVSTPLAASATPYAVQAKVRQGNITLFSVQNQFTVSGAAPGAVSITSPAQATTVAPGVTLTLSASVNGTPASVKFFANGAQIGVATSGGGWNYNWTPTAANTYSVLARSYDAGGVQLAESAPVVVTVSSAGSATPLPVTIAPPHLGNADAGSLPGSLDVGNNGNAVYSMPLAVPPGTAGMQPNLSLNYSSDAPNGMAGLGWSLGGLSTIHRCAKTIAQDGMAGRINFDGGDRLCLDGQRLVLASAANSTDVDVAYWATGAQYRTELESFARVTRLANGGFKVETKPGLIQWYGIDAASAIAAQGRTDGEPLLWALARTEDRSRNYMTYEYSLNAATGEYLPTQIRYSGNAAVTPAQAADLAVRFEYADRGDQQQRFIGGSRNDMMKRLAHIRTFMGTNADGSGGTQVRDHALQYKTSVISGRSMVESMQACAADPDNAAVTTCLPKTVFDWGGAASLAITRLPGTLVYPIIPHPTPGVETIYPDAGWHMSGNLDGKGRSSFIAAEYRSQPDNAPASCGLPDQVPCARITFDIPPGIKWKLSGLMYFRLSDGTEFNRTVKPTLPIQTALIEISQFMLGDLDGDGRDDLIVVFDYWAGELGYEKRESGWNYCLNKADAGGTLNFECHTGGYGPLHHAPTMVDLQGDRRMDLLMQGDTSNARMACSFPNGVVSCVSRTVNFTTPQAMLLDPMQFAEIGLSAQGATDLYTTWRTASPVASGTGVNVYGHWPDGWAYHQAESTAGAAICLSDKQGNYLCDKIFAETGVHAPGSLTPDSAPGVFGVQSVGDLNGDSLADFVFTVANSQTGKNGNYVCLSKETGVRCALDPELERLMPASATSQGGKIGDFVGDGVSRFLVSAPDGKSSQLCRHLLDKMVCEAFPYSAISSLYNVPLFMDDSGMPTFVDGTSVYIKDVDTPSYQSGHLLWTRWRVSMAGPAEQDRLVGVTNGLGQQDKVDYARGDAAAVYRRFAQVGGVERRPVYPQMSEPLGVVVKQRRQSNGQGGWLSTSYRYEGAMSDAEGRGSLGFTKLGITDEQTGAATELVLRQDYPYVGQVASRTVVRSGVTLVAETATPDLTSQSLPNGARTVFPYVKLSETKNRDLLNNSLGTTTVATEYDSWGNQKLQTVVMADGAATSKEVTSAIYTNDESAWLLGLPTHTTMTRSASDAPAVTRTVDVEYEPLTGLRKSLTVEPDSPTLRVRTDYGRAGNLFGLVNTTTTTWTDPSTATGVSDKVLDTVYDAKGRFPLNISNALGHTSILEHYAGTGARRKVIDANNLFATVKTDGFGRVKTTSWSGGREEREYDKQCAGDCPANAVTAHVVDTFMVDTLNGTSRIATPSVTYADSAGHVVRTTTWGMDGKPIMSDRLYDVRGRLFEVQRPRTDATVYLDRRVMYDDFDRVTSVVTLDDDGTPRTQTISYQGFVTTTIDAKSHVRAEGRDMEGRIVTIVDAKAGRTTLSYDAFGNLVSTIDPMNNTIKVEYDRLGRKTDLRDPNLGWLHYDVNPIGQVWRQISQKQRDKGAAACGTSAGTATCFKYDKLGRLVEREEPDLRGAWVYDTAANGKGRLAEAHTGTATAPDYRRVYAYDNLGRRAETTLWLMDGTYTDTPAYDAWGRLVRQSYRRGTDAAKVYDLRYDDKGMFARLERAGAVLFTVSARDAAGRLRKSVLGNGLARNVGFSANSARLMSDELTNAGASSLLNSGYFHDAVGNLERRTQYWDAKVGQARPGFDESFHYDELNRLKDSQVNGQAMQEFLYDAAGNITSKTGVGVYGYTTAGANAVQQAGNLGAFTYDKNGNVLTGGGRSNTWTSFDMPNKLAKGTDSATFIYGPEHQRVRQDRSDGVSVVYAGGQEVELKGGQVTSVKTFWPAGDGVEIDRPGLPTELLWIHKDRLGSPIAYSTAGGELKSEKLAYDAWGRRRYADGAAAPDSVDGVLDSRGYTDHEMLDRLDLVHMNGRVYDPLLGRFLSADPYIADPSNSQNYSRYTYVSDNPTNLTDPDGYAESCGPPVCEIVGQRPTFPSWYSNFERIRFDSNYANMFADTMRKGYAQAGRMARYAPTVARLAAQKSWKKMAVTIVVGGGPENPVADAVAVGMFVATAWEAYHIVAAADQGKDPADAVSNDALGVNSATGDPNDDDKKEKEKTRAEIRQEKIDKILKEKNLPTKGDVNFEPPKNWNPSEPMQRGGQRGYMDKYGREWTQGPSRTKGENFEWDVQLKNGEHLNVDWSGKITH